VENGERAVRYCQQDAGHAIAAVGLAAGGLGWKAALLDDLSTDSLTDQLGLIDLFREKRFDINCLDAKLRGLNRLETFVRLQQVNPYVYVVMMSGYGREEMVMDGGVKECLKKNVYAYNSRPFDRTQILDNFEGKCSVNPNRLSKVLPTGRTPD